MKTKYRIISHKTFIADRYLQFLSKEQKRTSWWWQKPQYEEVEVWRLVPEDTPAIVTGRYLYQDECPESPPWGEEANFESGFNDQDNFDLIPFTIKWPDIERYFEHLRKEREEYLIEQSAPDEPTKYIN